MKRRADRWVLPAALGLLAAAVALTFWRNAPGPPPPSPAPPATIPSKVPAPAPPAPVTTPRPQVKAFSVIIDDIGHNQAAAQAFLDMDQPLALSFLPHRPRTQDLAEQAHRSGKTVLLHLPMEPQGYPEVDPGDGAVLRSMDRARIRSVIDADLADVPFAVGLNNHMGSLATEDPRVMADVLGYAREKGFFFIDSLTSPRSVGRGQASALDVPSLSRDVFLDNEVAPQAIDRQADELLDLAESRGWAVGIGHPYPETALALARLSSRARQRGILWMPLPDLMAHADARH